MVLPIRATGVMVGTGASAFADWVPRNNPAGRTTAVATTARARRRFRLRGLGTSPPPVLHISQNPPSYPVRGFSHVGTARCRQGSGAPNSAQAASRRRFGGPSERALGVAVGGAVDPFAEQVSVAV